MVTPDHLKELKWTLPTWAMKPQFKACKLYVFHSLFKNPERDLAWIGRHFDDVQLIEWEMPHAENQREMALSAFILGSAKVVEEDYFCKLDADTYCVDTQDVWEEDDFQYSLVSHPWSYTKPGWWIAKLEAWASMKPWNGDESSKDSKSGKRIISYCCLHRTDFVKQIARLCTAPAGTQRLPVPSHDTTAWWIAQHFNIPWKQKNMKGKGVGHNSRWRHIRDNVCASPTVWNVDRNEELMRNIQLEITTSCNLGCPNCDRNCGTAPSSEAMTVEQVQRFADESDRCHHQWSRIDIIGGEPTLHPQLMEILMIVKPYADKVRLTSNGNGEKACKVLEQIPEWVSVRNSAKEDKDRHAAFEAVNVAPIDQGVNVAKMCSIPWRCGIALTRYGYFLCGAGASIARVFGLDIGIKSLAAVTPENLRRQAKQLCRYCGHSMSTRKTAGQEQETSPAWALAYKTYRDHQLELY